MKKSTWVFVLFQKLGKLWNILLGHFINHKCLFSEECFIENEPFSIFIKLQKNAKISISKGEEEGDEKSQFPYIHNNASLTALLNYSSRRFCDRKSIFANYTTDFGRFFAFLQAKCEYYENLNLLAVSKEWNLLPQSPFPRLVKVFRKKNNVYFLSKLEQFNSMFDPTCCKKKLVVHGVMWGITV